MTWGRQRKTKHNNARTYSEMIGRWFDSAAECRYGEHLWLRQKAGDIRDLQFQVTVPLVLNGVKLGISMRVDFKYYDEYLDELVWDEYKGFPTDQWKLKRKLWEAGAGPGLYRVTRDGNKVVRYPYDLIRPKTSEVTP